MKGKRTGSGKELGSAVSQPSSGLCCSLKQAGNGVGGGAVPGWLMSAFREETRAFMRCMQRAQAAAERSPEPEDTQNRSRPGGLCAELGALLTQLWFGESRRLSHEVKRV